MGRKRSASELNSGCRFWLTKKKRFCGRPIVEANQSNKHSSTQSNKQSIHATIGSDLSVNQSVNQADNQPDQQPIDHSTDQSAIQSINQPIDSPQYCGHHRTESKIACPHCSTLIQSINQSNHSQKCPAAIVARQRESWPYYRQSTNRRSVNQSVNKSSQNELLNEWLKIDIDALIEKINRSVNQSINQSVHTQDDEMTVDSIDQSMKKSSTFRHIVQCQSIASIIEKSQSINQSSVVVEMGAGTGLLGRVIRNQSIIQSLCLIDNQSFKHKFDLANNISKDFILTDNQSINQSINQSNHLTDTTQEDQSNQSANQPTNQSTDQSVNQSTTVKRLKLDIADFWLPGLPELYANQPINQSTDQSINQSSTRSVDQTASPSVSQSINQPSNESLNQSINPSNVVIVGKHLCGAATDFTIYSVEQSVNHLKQQPLTQSVNQSTNQPVTPSINHSTSQAINQSINQPFSINGVFIATCCHHRCSFDEYSNQSFLINQSISPSEFNLMCRMSAWGTLPVIDPRANTSITQSIDQSVDRSTDQSTDQTIDQSIDQSINQSINHSVNPSIDQSSTEEQQSEDHAVDESSHQILQSIIQSSKTLQSMTAQDRIFLGQSIKRLIDHGRLMTLNELGFNVSRKQFVSNRITPENHLCIATRRP